MSIAGTFFSEFICGLDQKKTKLNLNKIIKRNARHLATETSK